MHTDAHPRTIAFGDIHGCSNALAGLLEQIDPRADDTVITLGDYINRGPDSRGVIEQLIVLQEHCQFIPLLGNHDQVLLDCLDGQAKFSRLLAMHGDTTLASYGSTADGSAASLDAIPSRHIAFLRGCRMFHETDTHFFVHANYAPNLPLAETSPSILLWLSLRDSVPGPHQSGKIAIVGHTSQRTGNPLNLGHLICIDTGCVYGGRLTALHVETGEMWHSS